MHARDVMIRDVVAVAPDCLLSDMVSMMLGCGLSALPVVNADRVVVGIVSEGDLLRLQNVGAEDVRPRWVELLLSGARGAGYIADLGCRVEEVMSWPVLQVAPDTPIAEIAELFEHQRIKRVPVTEEGRLVGLVTCGNLLRALASLLPAEDDSQLKDRWVKQIVMGELRRPPRLPRAHEEIIVADGVVHLWGLVDTPAERRRLLARARKVPGVVAVRDHTFAGPG